MFVSADTGRTDTFAGRMGLFGIQAQLAASPSGPRVMSWRKIQGWPARTRAAPWLVTTATGINDMGRGASCAAPSG